MRSAIWWIGRSLRLEREVACDDWVILQTAAPRDYASSLTKVAGVALRQPALPFALRSRRELTGRVERLLDPMRNVAIQPIAVVVLDRHRRVRRWISRPPIQKKMISTFRHS